MYRVIPEEGKAVLFFVTAQANVPNVQWRGGAASVPPGDFRACMPYKTDDCLAYLLEDMFHAGLKAVEPKQLAAFWIWPDDLDATHFDKNNLKGEEARVTDGIVV